ncbi:hypothetical protein MYAER_0846 [Microcystis aeruginosa NIES-2549]|uniref:Uncharacterized protein n=1 Tax=Microcystis aeruginosa NIES-2549 TaxID=1641812 RepID=A0A0F6U1R2_MICAE|nr:hypothetical protein MYAER_0846 [Microcystis aeruginosa NIES-2549]
MKFWAFTLAFSLTLIPNLILTRLVILDRVSNAHPKNYASVSEIERSNLLTN